LFLDVDGTLLDLAETPDSVHVDEGLRGLMSRVDRTLEGGVALVSGRTIAELDRLFEPRRWPAAGVHGLERRDARGHWHVSDTVEPDAMGQARERLRQLSSLFPGTLFEDKGLSVAVHYRLAPGVEDELRRESRLIARETGESFFLLEGRKVLELRPKGTTKAGAIRAFLAEPPFEGRMPIFIGDDVTDQEALAYVQRMGGLAVAVGDRVEAMMRLSCPRDVRAFLEDLAEQGSP
jgi:trehalose 6-phosphate phosphatase